MKKTILFTISICILAASLMGCSSQQGSSQESASNVANTEIDADTDAETTSVSSTEMQSKELYAMDTYMTVKAYGDNAADALSESVEKIQKLDSLLSTGDENSEIYALNNSGSAVLSDTASYLYQRSMEINAATEGAFNPFVYPLMEAWGFTTDDYKVLTQSELNDLLPLTDVSKATFDAETNEITFAEDGMAIDFGGIAKGYTSDQVSEIMRKNNVGGAIINLGGNVYAVGTKADGSLWKVGIQDPEDSSKCLGILSLTDKCVITSGGYERYFTEDGKTYHHILDPATGMPADSGIISVSIISEDGTLADGLSTSLFVMGLDKATTFWRESGYEFDFVIMTDDKQLYISDGISDIFTSDTYKINVIKRNQ